MAALFSLLRVSMEFFGGRMTRQSTGKRLRFEVFKRDFFTCRYCGAQPPAVVLVLDHVLPVAAGGGTTMDNLVAACEPCNQGKADKQLGHMAPRVDADLLYLEAQQEIAEMRRYQEIMAQRTAMQERLINALQRVWVDYSGLKWAPADHVIRGLLNRYPVEAVDIAIRDVAIKVEGGYIDEDESSRWVGYLHKVARRVAEEGSGGELDQA